MDEVKSLITSAAITAWEVKLSMLIGLSSVYKMRKELERMKD